MATTKQQSALLPAYLIVGEDGLKRDAVLKRLHTRIAALGDIEFNSDTLNAEETTAADIVTACNTMPFMSPLRLVTVLQTEKLGKADVNELIDYLKNPNESAVLALVAEKLAKNTRLYKAVAALGKTAVIDCAPPKRYELPKRVREMATSHGLVFHQGAAEALIELVGEDTYHLDTEIQKIALGHVSSDPVTEREIRSLVTRSAEVKPWTFVDAFADRNLARCIDLLGQISSTSPQGLIAMCTNRLRELMAAQSLLGRGEIGQLGKTLGVPDWRVKNHARWARNFKPHELRHALKEARNAEAAMKSGSDASTVFLEWVVSTLKRPC